MGCGSDKLQPSHLGRLEQTLPEVKDISYWHIFQMWVSVLSSIWRIKLLKIFWPIQKQKKNMAK
jgi:hypothetical protein